MGEMGLNGRCPVNSVGLVQFDLCLPLFVKVMGSWTHLFLFYIKLGSIHTKRSTIVQEKHASVDAKHN